MTEYNIFYSWVLFSKGVISADEFHRRQRDKLTGGFSAAHSESQAHNFGSRR